MPAHEIVLLSCVKSKRRMACPAGEMYISPLFQKMMAYARSRKPQGIFILSAKYGLLSPETVIEPYELTLKSMRNAERAKWSETVLADLSKHTNIEKDHFVFLAGLPYRERLLSHIKNYFIPMEGLSFGKQLQWLEGQLK